MKRLLLLVGLLVLALVVFLPAAVAQDGGVEAVPVQDARSVEIGDNFFDPPDVAVEPGSTITWTNNGDEPHTVTADDGSFDSGMLNPGDSYTVAFGGQGTVTYHCEIHPEMRGSVTVGGGAVQHLQNSPLVVVRACLRAWKLERVISRSLTF